MLETLGIETVGNLATCYDGVESELQTRRALRQVNGFGPKTVDYLAILVGSARHVAVDMHITGFVRDAGIVGSDYRAITTLITRAANELGCSAAPLDAAIWNHMSDPEGGATSDA
ncbi:hypothetical protein ACTWPB_22625 [Nocardia sp. IBHARD005]|uniref:hypothetical protein n=1 Tax=Nocardia sp. IBHARD005 TaxID=3457765 RepID=UPI00405979C7